MSSNNNGYDQSNNPRASAEAAEDRVLVLFIRETARGDGRHR